MKEKSGHIKILIACAFVIGMITYTLVLVQKVWPGDMGKVIGFGFFTCWVIIGVLYNIADRLHNIYRAIGFNTQHLQKIIKKLDDTEELIPIDLD